MGTAIVAVQEPTSLTGPELSRVAAQMPAAACTHFAVACRRRTVRSEIPSAAAKLRWVHVVSPARPADIMRCASTRASVGVSEVSARTALTRWIIRNSASESPLRILPRLGASRHQLPPGEEIMEHRKGATQRIPRGERWNRHERTDTHGIAELTAGERGQLLCLWQSSGMPEHRYADKRSSSATWSDTTESDP
jgi:hypothetical protein